MLESVERGSAVLLLPASLNRVIERSKGSSDSNTGPNSIDRDEKGPGLRL